MRLEKATIENYKSFGKPSSIYLGGENVISIIGKNESGKSNLLDALEMLSFTPKTNEQYNFRKFNRSIGEGTTKIRVILTLTSKEKSLLNIRENNTHIIFSLLENTISLDLEKGGIIEYFEKEKFQELLSNIEAPITNEQISLGNQRNEYNDRIGFLKKANKMVVRSYDSHLNWLKKNVGNKLNTEDREEYIKVLEDMRIYFEMCYNLLPKFFKYNEIFFKDSYTLNDSFFKNVKSENPEVITLLSAISMDVEDLKKATNLDGPGSDKREEISKAVSEIIEKPFGKFYTVEPIKIKTEIFPNRLSIQINSGNGNMNLSERSNGLKWYLSFFITLLANGLLDEKVIFLIDEPGISLHVEAQKKLLELFNSKGVIGSNQIIYTTHSPFMIDKNNIDSVRAMEKINGQSKILKIYSDDIDRASRLETLSPLLNAIGMKLSDNVGFDVSKVNILTEGITDFIYLSAMKQYLDIENCVIVPSTGADKLELMTLILWGWGLKFLVVFDDDEKGRVAANKLKRKLEQGHPELAPTVENIISSKIKFSTDNNVTIEDLISSSDYEILGKNYTNFNDKLKIVLAQNFYTKVVREKVNLSNATVENFQKIFKYVNKLE